jgi:hypothetical protein
MNEIEPQGLSRKNAAKYLGICLNTLDNLDIPRIRIGVRVVYRRATLEKFLEEGEAEWKNRRKG